MICDIFFQLARAQNARISNVCVFVEHRLERWKYSVHSVRHDFGITRGQAAIDVNMCPRPELIGAGERYATCFELDKRKRLIGDDRAIFKLIFFEDDEHDPWTQTMQREVWCGGGIAPWELFVIELDARHVIWLEVGDPV